MVVQHSIRGTISRSEAGLAGPPPRRRALRGARRGSRAGLRGRAAKHDQLRCRGHPRSEETSSAQPTALGPLGPTDIARGLRADVGRSPSSVRTSQRPGSATSFERRSLLDESRSRIREQRGRKPTPRRHLARGGSGKSVTRRHACHARLEVFRVAGALWPWHAGRLSRHRPSVGRTASLMEKARLGMLHQVPEALRQLLKEAGFEWAAWNASWRHAVSGAQVTFAELRDHLDEAWLRQRIAESLRAARRPLPSGPNGAASSVILESDREAQRMY